MTQETIPRNVGPTPFIVCTILIAGLLVLVPACREKREQSRLVESIILGDMSAAGLILDRGVDPNIVGAPRGRSLLTDRCYWGDVDGVSLLLEHGADPERWDSKGETGLTSAAAGRWVHGSGEVVDLLLRVGADPLRKNSKGELPLEIAIAVGSPDVVTRLRAAHLQ